MWSGWAEALVADVAARTTDAVRGPLFAMLGYDPLARVARPGGGLISTPMARLREMTIAVLVDTGVAPSDAQAVVAAAWHAPDPATLVHPLADLPSLFDRLRADGRRIAIATSDDREPTLRSLDALGVRDRIDAIVCADDGVTNKPSGDPVLHLCRDLAIEPARTAVVGDSPADIAMGRRADAGLVLGVRTGIGTDADLADADLIIDAIGDLEGVLPPSSTFGLTT